ncbi:hypothetical protein C2I17_02585 [Niallia circulans]|uniref:flagellar hook-length control protein FliK n=1 Tax=Niallia circulans TaxID=1397 RepID=UPI00201D9B0D|nr:flagellar hook-length control protein FliK [Niallia circulans]UQZ73535.1 hypothetical protein C2I17_02585 [Niallia circulans]
MQLELNHSLKKIESASSTQGITRGKVSGNFLSLIKDLNKTYQHSSPAQPNVSDREGLNQLLAIFSSTSIDGNLQQNMDTETLDTRSNAEQIRINLEYLLTNYHRFSNGEEILASEEPEMDAKLANILVNLENKIAQELKKTINMKIEPDIFNNTELSSLLADLKLLEQTVGQLPDKSIEEKIAASMECLLGFMILIKQFLDQDGINKMKNDSQKMENLKGDTLTSQIFPEGRVANFTGTGKNSFPLVDAKLITTQNYVSQENKDILFNGTNTNGVTTELKSVISSILSKMDTQTNEKKTTVIQKVINPIMVSALKKSEEDTLSSTEIQKSAQVSYGDGESKVISTIQNNIFKEHPLTLLTDSGELTAPKNVEEQFAKLLAKSTFVKTGNIQTLTIRLAPDHLGSIRIEVTQNEGNMIARIITANTEAKDVLEKQLTSLKHGLTAQNLQVDKVDIVVSPQSQDRLQRDQQQEQQHPHQQREKKDANDDENKQKTSFIEELLNIEV